ncbi:unnamed protein product [Urochloa humidicola]
MVRFPKIRKFNNKASFPPFDALGELYDGHLAQGTYNVTSLEEESPEQLHDAVNEPPLLVKKTPLKKTPMCCSIQWMHPLKGMKRCCKKGLIFYHEMKRVRRL